MLHADKNILTCMAYASSQSWNCCTIHSHIHQRIAHHAPVCQKPIDRGFNITSGMHMLFIIFQYIISFWSAACRSQSPSSHNSRCCKPWGHERTYIHRYHFFWNQNIKLQIWEIFFQIMSCKARSARCKESNRLHINVHPPFASTCAMQDRGLVEWNVTRC